ncbi:MAG: hypothetical protein ACT4PV_01875 [Planctomycetaceae bacterium]
MTEGTVAVCPRCGKKYKLKEGFTASGFACKECGATVKVGEAKPASPVSGRSSSSRVRPAARAGRGRAEKPAAARGRASRRDAGAEQEEQRGGRGSRSQRGGQGGGQKVVVIGGALVLALILVLFVTMKKKDKGPAPELTGGTPTAENPANPGTGGEARKPAVPTQPTSDTPPTPDKPPDSSDKPPVASDNPPVAPDKPKIGGERPRELVSAYDAPADLPHLEDTPPEVRARIDELIKLVMDPDAGAASLRAKSELILIGKPAFLRILGAMAQLRDTITDVDSFEERLLESSLKLCDEALREMDGWLSAKGKSVLRPGSEKKYIAYIIRMHYKRWKTDLEKLDKVPGPFDPSSEYAGEVDPE